MTTMDTTMPTLADLRRADQTRRAIEAGGRPSLDDLRHLNRIKGGATPAAPAFRSAPPGFPTDTLLGFTPSDQPGPGSVPVDAGYSYPREDPGPTPETVAKIVDPLVGYARSPLILAQQVAGLGEAVGVPGFQTAREGIGRVLRDSPAQPQTFVGRATEQVFPLAAAIGTGGAMGGGLAASARVGGLQALGGTMAGARERGATMEQARGEAAISGVTGAATGALPISRFATRATGGNPVGGLLGDLAAQTVMGTGQAAIDAGAASWIEQNPELWAQFKGSMGETAAMNAVLGLVGHGVSLAGSRLQETPGPVPGGAAEVAGAALRPGDATAPTAPTPDQAQARAAEAAPVPNPAESAPLPPARGPVVATETPQPVQGPKPEPVAETPKAVGGDVGALGANSEGATPVRSTDRLAPGDTLTDPAGKPFTVRTILDSGKVVARAEDGSVVRRTAGEMEARGWRRQAPDGPLAEPARGAESPAPLPREAASEVSPRPDERGLIPASTPEPTQSLESVRGSSPNDTGRVGPPPAEVANPPGMPKGNRPESPESSTRPEKSRTATPEVAAGVSEKQPWEMSPGEFLDWTRTEGFRAARSSAEQRESEALSLVQQMEHEVGTTSKSMLKSAGTVPGMAPKSFALLALADAQHQQQAFDRALSAMPEDFRHRYEAATRAYELAHARTRVFEDVQTAREMVADHPDLAPRPEKSQPATPEVAPPEPNQPGFWQSLRDRAQTRINERRAAELAASKGKAGRRGSAGSLDPQTIADRAIILASHVAEAGIKGAKAIKAKARELFGSDDPAVVRSAYQMLRESQGADGNLDPARLELAAHDTLTEAQAEARTAPNESADIREMMAKREGMADVRAEKAAKWEAVKKARAEERARAKNAAAVAKAKAELADERAMPGKLADQLARDEKVSGKAFKSAEREAHSSFGKQIRQERTDAERRVQNAADAAVNFERDAGKQSASIREMMAKREGDRRVAEAKAEAKQKAQNKAETAQYLKQEAVAAERAKGQIKADVAEATRKEQAARDKTRMDVAVGLEREAGQQSADIREGMAKRAGEIALSKAAQEARAKREEQRKAFYAQIQTEQGRRSDLATLARDMLGDADARKVIKGIAEARSERDQVKIIQRVLDLREARADTESRAYLRGVTGRETVKKPPTLASVIAKLMGIKAGDPKTARKGRLSKTDVDELRTDERNVVKPVWEAIRKDMAPDTAPLADHIEAVAEKSGRTVFSPEQIRDLRNAAGKPLDRMTPEQRRAVADALNHAAWLSDNANAIIVAGKRRDLQEARAKVGEEIQAFTGPKETKDPKNAILNSLNKAVTVDQLDTSRLVTSLAGRGSEAHKILYEAPALAESDALLTHGKAEDALSAVAEKHGMTRARLARMAVRKPFKLASGPEVQLSASDRMIAAGLWSDPQNRPEILKTGLQYASEKGTVDRIVRVTEADMEAIDRSLSPFEREWLNTFKKQANRLYALANDAHERMTGFRLEERPDHFSRSRDLSATEREVDPQAQQHGQQVGWVEDSGIFQKRTGATAPILIPENVFAWGDRHLRTLSSMAHIAEPILAARRLLADPALRTVMDRAGGKKWVEALTARLQAMSGARETVPNTGVEAATSQVIGFVAKNRLAYRITSAIKQRLGFINAWIESDGGRQGASILRQALDPTNLYSPTLAKELTDNSGYFRVRMNAAGESLATAADTSRVTSATRIGRAYDAFMNAGMKPHEIADASVNVGIYRAYKADLYRQGLRGQELIRAAVRATEMNVRRSQNPTSAADKSGLNLSRNALLRFATLFSSPANKMRNQFTEAVREFQTNPTGDNAKRYARAYVGMIGASALSALMSYYMGKGVQKGVAFVTGNTDDERNPATMKDVAKNAVGELAGVVNLWPGSDSLARQALGSRINNAGVIDGVVQAYKAVQKTEEDETMRGSDKAVAWIKLARALPVVPDALLDYAGQTVKGAAGPEPAGWSIAAALKRNDYKTALQRAQKLAALKLQKTKDGEPVDPETVRQSIQASIAAYLNRGLKKGVDDDAIADNAATARDLASDAMP